MKEGRKIRFSEAEILSTIERVLTENTFLKTGKGGGQNAQMPMNPPMGMGMSADPSMGMGGDPSMGGGMGAPADPSMGMDGGQGMPMDSDSGNEFDTNFDAGVEADENSDPKKYIQQLTGKLSQSLNSFNNDNGADAGLCKYVAGMIIKATCKFLDDKAKKELCEKINSAQSEGDMGNDSDMGDSDTPMDGGDSDMPVDSEAPQQPMMEKIITKKDIMKILESINNDNAPYDERDDDRMVLNKSNKRGPFSPKIFR